jgi:hypothetical protein
MARDWVSTLGLANDLPTLWAQRARRQRLSDSPEIRSTDRSSEESSSTRQSEFQSQLGLVWVQKPSQPNSLSWTRKKIQSSWPQRKSQVTCQCIVGDNCLRNCSMCLKSVMVKIIVNKSSFQLESTFI